MAAALFRKTVTIRFQDCDPAGIVYYPNFIDMAEAAIEDWMTGSLGESYRDWLFQERRALPRVKVTCDFAKPCRMEDRLELILHLRKLGRSSLELEVAGRVAGEPCLKIGLVLVNMSLDSHKAVPFADGLRAKLERYRALDAAER
jgi:4-hydroxybenzoyl-CoA thioesterase